MLDLPLPLVRAQNSDHLSFAGLEADARECGAQAIGVSQVEHHDRQGHF